MENGKNVIDALKRMNQWFLIKADIVGETKKYLEKIPFIEGIRDKPKTTHFVPFKNSCFSSDLKVTDTLTNRFSLVFSFLALAKY